MLTASILKTPSMPGYDNAIESELLALVMAQLDHADFADQISAQRERGENANLDRCQRLHFLSIFKMRLSIEASLHPIFCKVSHCSRKSESIGSTDAAP
jgi:hypothetical protein